MKATDPEAAVNLLRAILHFGEELNSSTKLRLLKQMRRKKKDDH